MNTMHSYTNSIHGTISYALRSCFNMVYALTLVYMTIIFLEFNCLGKELALLYVLWVFCIILHFTQRIEFVVFIKSVCFGTLIPVENSHFNEYSICTKFQTELDEVEDQIVGDGPVQLR